MKMRRPIKMPACKQFLRCLAAILLFLPSAYAINRAHYSELSQRFRTLAKQKDWQGARNVLAEIGKELPAPTPRYFLLVASVEAHLGHKAESLQWLQKYAATGLSYDLTRDDDLKALLAEEAGQKLVAEMKQTSQPVEKAEFLCTLPQADTMPEDIAYVKSSDIKSLDSKSGDGKSSDRKSAPSFIISSIQHRTLYRLSLPKAGSSGAKAETKECTMQELPLPEEAKRWPTLAVSAAPDGKTLWMTANAMPGFSGFPKEDEGKAALFQIDVQSGKVLHRYDLAEYPAARPAVLGDMQVAQDGTVYVTDSIGGGVYRLRQNSRNTKGETAKLEKIADGLFSPQTPALSRDGKRLFVADYSMGIVVIDLTTPGTATRLNYLPHPENVAVVGLDGLYLSGDSLIGIQNGTEPNRILQMKLNAAQTEIINAEVIEQATERMGDPTHAVPVDGWFYVSANVGWSKVEDNGKLKDGEKFTPPVLLRFPAPGRAGK